MTGGQTVGNSRHATDADHATEADHAVKADHATEADHAAKAADLDENGSKKFLRKDQDDATPHKLGMGEAEVTGNATVGGDAAVKGNLKIGADGSYSISKEGIATLAGAVAEYFKSPDFTAGTAMGFDGRGFGVTKDKDGKYTLEVDNFIARMKMIVAQLEVHTMSFIGGEIVMSPCGNKMSRIEALDKDGNVLATSVLGSPSMTIPSGKTAASFRCYFLASDGDYSVKNEWTVGQLARCKTNNLSTGQYTDYQNRDYWRLVVGVSSAPVEKDGKSYHYIDLSNNPDTGISITDENGTVHIVDKIPGVSATLNSLPQAGDDIVGMGHNWYSKRQDVAYFSASGWTLYKGIDHYDLPEERIVNMFGIDKAIITTDHLVLRPYAQPTDTSVALCDRGIYSADSSYGFGDLVSYGGQLWKCVVKLGSTVKGEAPSVTSANWVLYVAKGDTGARGDKGDPGNDGHTPAITIGTNGNWLIDGKDSGQKAQGNDGHTPTVTIGSDGYWYIDNTKTSQKAQGETGAAAVQYSVKQLNTTQALVKPSSTGTDATFKLYAYLDFQVNKNVGGTTTNPVITSIKATADGETWSNSNVGSTEAQLTCNGSTSYTSSKRPPSSLQVEIVCEGEKLYATVPVTIEAGVAIDINQKIGQLQTTVAGKADISTIKQTANEISMSIASQKTYRNLLKGTDFSYIPDNMSLNANGDGNVVEITDKVLYDSDKTLHINIKNTGYYDGIYMRPITIQTKTAYVFSVWAKGSGKIALETIYQDDSGNRAGRPDFHGDNEADLTPDWKLYTVYFTSGDTYTKLECNIWANYVADSEMWIAHPMLEASEKYSGWTLSPDDPTTEQLLAQTGIDIRKGVIDLRAGKVAFLGANGNPYIKAELDDEGMPHLIFYNKAGTAMYDLGYTGLFNLIQDSDKQSWVNYTGQIIDGDTAQCASLTGGNYRFVDNDIVSPSVLERTVYEYHPASIQTNGKKTYYNSDCKNQLYLSTDVDESLNNKPTGEPLYTDNGTLQLNGYLYELVERKVVSKTVQNGTTTIEEHFRFSAHTIIRNRLNLSDGMSDYNDSKTVKIKKLGTAIFGSIETKYQVSIDGSDYEDKDIIKLSL